MIHKLATAVSLTFLAASAAQAEARELGAHQHGHGALNIAFEGGVVAMELEAPGADIVGFEHPAETAEDRAMVDAAIAQLAKPLDLFLFPAAAGCTVTAANVALLGDDADHEDHSDEHKEEHKDEHAHDDDHKDEHAHEGHSDEAGGESHTEFHAEYALACADPKAIDAIEFVYFDLFPNAAELDIQMISDKGAKGFEVERDEPRLSLSGAI